MSFAKLCDSCEDSGMEVEICRLPSERPGPNIDSGKSDFKGFIIRVIKEDKGICKTKVEPKESLDDSSADLISFLLSKGFLR